MAGHAVDFSEDIPKRDINPADCGAADDSIAVPEVLAVHHLPEMLDACRIFADKKLGKIFDGANDRASVPFEGGFTPSPETGLIGNDLDENPIAHPRVANERLN